MILHSDNVGFKRPKQNEEEEEDIISRLPDEILTHILSFLPDVDAYHTRILSNRWNHLCSLLPFLHFKMPSSYQQPLEVINKFHDFVDKTFALRGINMPVKRFFLSCSYDYDYNRVLDWLRIVLHSKLIQTLELRFPSDRDRFSLSLDLFKTCNNTLVDLTLKDVTMLLAVDETQLIFPYLKRVKLESMEYTGDQSPQNLISACPVLQELFLDKQKLHSQLHAFKISSPSLKRLRIQWCVFGKHEVVIDAPKLEYFYLREYEFATYSLTNPSSLVEAHINIYNESDIQLLTSVSSARILTLGSDSLLGLHRNSRLNMPVFPNFVKLTVDFDDIRSWDMLFILLNSMPNLQHITISFGQQHIPFKREWNPPRRAPSCLRFMVKEILILNKEAVQVRDHVALIRYLLKHSSFLEKMTLNSHYINHEKREKLLNIHRRSKSCRIEFV